jgi:hypothetical protein
MTDSLQHLPILTRVGKVLLIVGALDIGVMFYCILNGISYASSFNIFAVCLGILLMRGSLWAAAAVRFFSAFLLAGGIGLIAVCPLLQPISLTVAEVRHTSPFVVVLPLLLLALSFWMARELNAEPVIGALEASGKSVSPLLVPVVLGFGLVAAVAGVVAFT